MSFRSIDFSSEKKKRKKLEKGAPPIEPDLVGERKASFEADGLMLGTAKEN